MIIHITMICWWSSKYISGASSRSHVRVLTCARKYLTNERPLWIRMGTLQGLVGHTSQRERESSSNGELFSAVLNPLTVAAQTTLSLSLFRYLYKLCSSSIQFLEKKGYLNCSVLHPKVLKHCVLLVTWLFEDWKSLNCLGLTLVLILTGVNMAWQERLVPSIPDYFVHEG